jgi:hypothetical protein
MDLDYEYKIKYKLLEQKRFWKGKVGLGSWYLGSWKGEIRESGLV